MLRSLPDSSPYHPHHLPHPSSPSKAVRNFFLDAFKTDPVYCLTWHHGEVSENQSSTQCVNYWYFWKTYFLREQCCARAFFLNIFCLSHEYGSPLLKLNQFPKKRRREVRAKLLFTRQKGKWKTSLDFPFDCLIDERVLCKVQISLLEICDCCKKCYLRIYFRNWRNPALPSPAETFRGRKKF